MHDGQKPRPLQLNATTRFSPHLSRLEPLAAHGAGPRQVRAGPLVILVLVHVDVSKRVLGPRHEHGLVLVAAQDVLGAALAGSGDELAEERAVVEVGRSLDRAVPGHHEGGAGGAVAFHDRPDHRRGHEGHVGQHDDDRPRPGGGQGDPQAQRRAHTLRVIGVDHRQARQPGQRGPDTLGLVPEDDHHLVDTRCDRGPHRPADDRLPAQIQQQLVLAHPRGGAGGEHDGSHDRALSGGHGPPFANASRWNLGQRRQSTGNAIDESSYSGSSVSWTGVTSDLGKHAPRRSSSSRPSSVREGHRWPLERGAPLQPLLAVTRFDVGLQACQQLRRYARPLVFGKHLQCVEPPTFGVVVAGVEGD